MLFRAGDAVWVRLNTCQMCQWWPGMVVDRASCPMDHRGRKKDVIAFVKFFSDCSFERITKEEDIQPFHCKDQVSFVKAGQELLKRSPNTASDFFFDLRASQSRNSAIDCSTLRKYSTRSTSETPAFLANMCIWPNAPSSVVRDEASVSASPNSASLPQPRMAKALKRKHNHVAKSNLGDGQTTQLGDGQISQSGDGQTTHQRPCSPTIDELVSRGGRRSKAVPRRRVNLHLTPQKLEASPDDQASSVGQHHSLQNRSKSQNTGTESGINVPARYATLPADSSLCSSQPVMPDPVLSDFAKESSRAVSAPDCVTPDCTLFGSQPVLPDPVLSLESKSETQPGDGNSATKHVNRRLSVCSVATKSRPRITRKPKECQQRQSKAKKTRMLLEDLEEPEYELTNECSSPVAPPDTGSDINMASVLGDSDSDLEEISFVVMDDSLDEGGLVWFQYQNRPFWPAVLKKKYVRKRKLERVSLLIIGNHPDGYRFLRMAYRKDRILPFSTQQDLKFKEMGLGSKWSNTFRDAIDSASTYNMRKALGATKLKAVEYFQCQLPLVINNSEEDADLEEEEVVEDGKNLLLTDFDATDADTDSVLITPEDGAGKVGEETTLKQQPPLPSGAIKARDQRTKKYLTLIKRNEVKEHLLKIYKRETSSARHDLYFKPRKTKAEEFEQKLQGWGPIVNENQIDELTDTLVKYYQDVVRHDDKYDMMKYISAVWIPEAVIYAIQKRRRVCRAKAEKLFSQGPRRLKVEEKLLQLEMDSKTLTKEDKKLYRQRHNELPYSESEDEDEED